MKLNIAGIRRENKYSPNHIGNDAAIFDLTVEHLKEMGCRVKEYSESEFTNLQIREEIIFDMARDKCTIDKLQKLENQGYLIINSGYGIENCTREKMTRLLISNQIPHPKSVIIPTNNNDVNDVATLGNAHFWIKRGDFHAIHREDVTYAKSLEETRDIIREYALRDIATAVVNEHLSGDLIKFYGVSGTTFFYWFYPTDLNHSKFGHEEINGHAKGTQFSLDELKSICEKAANVLNIRIYGGDAVVATDGNIKIIDFNDWPSFAPCRKEAAPFIASCIYEAALKTIK